MPSDALVLSEVSMAIPDRTRANGRHEPPPNSPTAPAVPPQSIEAEQSVLGAVLLSDQTLYALRIELNLVPDDFYRPAHGLIYGAMLALYEQGEPGRPRHGHRAG